MYECRQGKSLSAEEREKEKEKGRESLRVCVTVHTFWTGCCTGKGRFPQQL